MAKQLSLIPTTKSTFRLPVDLHRRLKHRAVEEDRPIAEVVADAIECYLAKTEAGAKPASQS
jgi:predicted DNA-binding protein